MIAALVPLLVTLAAVLATALLGLTQRSAFGTALEPYAYGFFFDRTPVFAFAILYGGVRILAAALLEPGRRRLLRALAAAPALALFLAASLYPTFGGFVLRAGYFAGAGSFLSGTPALASFGIGAAATALVYGLALGAAVALARLQLTVSRRALGRAVLVFFAAWFGALVLDAPRAFGLDLFGGWPKLPLSAPGAFALAGLVALSLGPHAMAAGPRRPVGEPPPAGRVVPEPNQA